MADPGYSWPLRPDHWDRLIPGTPVTLVKRTDAAGDVVRYPGVVVPTRAEMPWVEIEAIWTAGTVEQGSLVFESGDVLREFFSWQHPYNAFAVYTPDHLLKGWYGNVTWPSWAEVRGNGVVLIWHDLVLDLVATPDGEALYLDEDELAASGLADTDPALHAAILDARGSMHAALRARTGPFTESRFD